MKRGTLALLSILLLPGSGTAKTILYVQNYVNSNEIQSLVSWNGLVAMGTLGGIVTVDPARGTLRKILRSPGGLPSNRVLAVAVSPSGLLWAGTQESGIARLRPDFTFRRTLTSFDGLPSDRVQAIATRGDSVWVGTSAGVALFTESPAGQIGLTRAFTSASTSGGLVGDDVRALASWGDTLWVATTSGLSAFAGGAWIDRSAALGPVATSFTVFADTLWAATDLGPYRYASGVFQAVNEGHPFASRALAAIGPTLYSGTNAFGVSRYDPAGGSWSSVSTGLPSPRVTSLAAGPDGALWAGTLGGAARLAGGVWTPYPSDGPLVSGTERAVADRRGVWFTTGNDFPPGIGRGVVLHFDGVSWSAITSFNTNHAFQEADAFAILSAADGRLWIGHCCADVAERPRIDRYDPATGLFDYPAAYNIWAIAQAPGGLVYAGSVEHENGLYVFDGSSGALLDSLTPGNSGLTSNNLRAAEFDATGKGWFGSAFNGLDVWDGKGTLTHADDTWTHHPVQPSDQVTSIAVVNPQSAWIGTTSGAGLLQQNGLFTRVLVNPTLPSGQVADVALDGSGNVWIATSAGLVRADANGGGAVEVFTTADGLVDDDIRALAWDSDRGVLWVGTANGISRVAAGLPGDPAITASTYVYPNPSRAAGTLRLGGIQNALTGEIRDVAGNVIHRFRCDPAANEIWDLKTDQGDPVASGIYLVVLRDVTGSEKTLRAAVVR